MKNKGRNRDQQKLLARLIKLGCTIEPTSRTGRYRILTPPKDGAKGQVIVVGASADWHAERNNLARLRRAGIDV